MLNRGGRRPCERLLTPPSAHNVRSTLERWFRSLKSEWLKVEEYETPRQLRALIDEYVRKYNNRRTHESLDYETPASWYYSGIAARQAA